MAGGWLALRASLPQLEGEARLPGLSAPVTIGRDAAGVPVIRGATRTDVARATGYAHAQDRWFQMDLLRRVGAGELAALLGRGLVPRDRAIRRHQFRRRAQATLAGLAPEERALLEAYAEGANAGLASLRLPPFEYLVLGSKPRPWSAEDSLLVGYAQWIDLQGLDAHLERQNGRLAAVLPPALHEFLAAPDPAFEAPLDGSASPQVPLPTPEEYDLRRVDRALFEQQDARLRRAVDARGSNNFALAGPRVAGGGALLANDMHLGLRVPNVWYRARLVVEDDGLDLAGVTLPGLPLLVAGSNRHVAWGYTNSYGDFQDLVVIERADEGRYLGPDGPRPFEQGVETIEVAGDEPVPVVVRSTAWGPVVGWDGFGHELALAWTAHRPGALDLSLRSLERARDLDAAAAILAGAGMPAQNALIADRAGRIGWVLTGRIPMRGDYDPRRPVTAREAGALWAGWLPREESPRLLDPEGGAAWSANARVVGGEDHRRIGDGGLAPAVRARQIRARLEALAQAKPADLLAIQLDDRADYLAFWQAVMVPALERAAEWGAARLVARWSGRAATDDAGYRLVREFERRVQRRAFAMLTVEAQARWPRFPWSVPQGFTVVAWRLVRERPAHLLDPRYRDWDAWLADIAAETARELPAPCRGRLLDDCTWGRVNEAAIRHPLSGALPILGGLLDMPRDPLPGDWSVPRVQAPTFGASERFVVSPGREAEGIFHMPGGQSGHPLSPFYRAGHADWVRGEPSPFLPGHPAHVLRLVPL